MDPPLSTHTVHFLGIWQPRAAVAFLPSAFHIFRSYVLAVLLQLPRLYQNIHHTRSISAGEKHGPVVARAYGIARWSVRRRLCSAEVRSRATAAPSVWERCGVIQPCYSTEPHLQSTFSRVLSVEPPRCLQVQGVGQIGSMK